MKKLTIIFALLIIGLSAQITLPNRKRQRPRGFYRQYETFGKKPFDPNAPAARNWNFKYIADTDEVSVVVCGGALKLIPEKKNKFKGELLMQYTFGMAVFKFENPDKKNDENAAQLAGLESMLRTYEVMIAENEKAKNAELDALIVKRDNGELKSIIEAADCGKK